MTTPAQPTPPTVPSTPDPSVQTLVYTLIRAGLTIAGAVGVTTPAWAGSQSNLWAIAGAVAVLVGIGWSIVEKIQASRAAHTAAVISAQAGVPLKPTATTL